MELVELKALAYDTYASIQLLSQQLKQTNDKIREAENGRGKDAVEPPEGKPETGGDN